MPKIRYDSRLRFTEPVLLKIAQANEIIEEYAAKGFSLTLRSLYYQFVARGLVPENTIRQYKQLGEAISRARIAGLVDWYAISDNTRYMREMGFMPDPWTTAEDPSSWTEVAKYLPFLKDAANSWNVDMWSNQKHRPIVLVEKDAAINSVEGICNELEVPYFAARGYMSQSAQWRLGQQLRAWKAGGQEPIVFHIGDHDPSGMDMTRDNEDRLWMFGGFAVQLIRLALNMDQIEEYNPPPMPAKKTDSRTTKYMEQQGSEDSWELDALDPTVIEDLVRQAVLGIRDEEAWELRIAQRDQQREEIKALVETLNPKEPEPRDPYAWYDPYDR